jgi:outer membrane protein OmpA-like peptidoglycan-associated protein
VRSIAAKAGSTVTATITSTAQTQNAAVQLTGGTVNLNLQVSSVPSQITAYLTNQWVTLHAKTNGFEVINKSNTYFNAQTPNYDTSTQEKLDVNATASQSSMNIVANFNEK